MSIFQVLWLLVFWVFFLKVFRVSSRIEAIILNENNSLTNAIFMLSEGLVKHNRGQEKERFRLTCP